MSDWTIGDIRALTIDTVGVGGDYGSWAPGHWIVDSPHANPLSVYPDGGDLRSGDASRAVGGILIEVETGGGVVGLATGVGGPPACCIIEHHLKHFLIGRDARDIAGLWDLMYRASLPYGRGGVASMAISAVDLALWDLLGQLRREPVFKMAGATARDSIPAYCTGPFPVLYRDMGFVGAKVALPFGMAAGDEGFRRNVETVATHRQALGPDFRFMIDCYMAFDAGYAADLARACAPSGLYWIEEALQPDDLDGMRRLKAAVPDMRWVTGEHEYSRYGFRNLIASGAVDVLQPDLMWCGGFTEALRIGALAAAHDIPVSPHAGGVYAYHFAMTQTQTPFVEYCMTSPKGDEVHPVFGNMFDGEPLPLDGKIVLTDAPGWGLEINRDAVALSRPFGGD